MPLVPINDNTYSNDVNTHLSYEIGDSLQPSFFPQIKIKKWGNEVNFSQRLLDFGMGAHSFDGNKVIWTGSGANIEISDTAGSASFKIILLSKPPTRTIRFSIELKGLELTKQLPLTIEEIAAGDKRPENIINSYAAYHDSKVNGEYQTGKAFHLYAPLATDDIGETVYCDQNINVPLKILTVEIPQTFYDSATYPVVIA